MSLGTSGHVLVVVLRVRVVLSRRHSLQRRCLLAMCSYSTATLGGEKRRARRSGRMEERKDRGGEALGGVTARGAFPAV